MLDTENNKDDLLEIVPTESEFQLESTGDQIHKLRPISLEDRAWAHRYYGGAVGVEAAFKDATTNVGPLVPFIYHQLVDKGAFPARQKKSWYGDNGIFYYTDETDPKVIEVLKTDALAEKVEKPRITVGPESLMAACQGVADHLIITGAMLKCMGLSSPQLNLDVEEYKKKVRGLITMAMKETEGAGSTSITPSPTPTDGPSPK